MEDRIPGRESGWEQEGQHMNEKIFIIGFGFIGRYLAPCYEALLGQPTPEQVLAVKASSRGV